MKYKPSLLVIGNSNVGKSSITRLLLPNPKNYKGKTGKQPGSTLIIKSVDFPQMPYKIVDLPGFGYMKSSSRRREEHIKKQLVIHIEKNHNEFFLGLVVLGFSVTTASASNLSSDKDFPSKKLSSILENFLICAFSMSDCFNSSACTFAFFCSSKKL